MSCLPILQNPAHFSEQLFRPGQWLNAIDAIRQRHRLTEHFTQSRDGSTVVFLSEQRCVKLHPPFPEFVDSHQRESAALGSVSRKLPIATPELLAEGELEAWPYFITKRLPGHPIDVLWDRLDPGVRIDLAIQLGEATRELHRLDSEPVARITEPWKEFRTAQRACCLERERDGGLAPSRLDELERYLERVDQIADLSSTSAILHTELGPSHVLVEDGRITGLIDFGDAMVGDPEYDIAPVGMFVTRGDRAAFKAFCRAYGQDASALTDPNREARLLRHALLHRYGTLRWYLKVLNPPPGSLDALASYWFGVDELTTGSVIPGEASSSSWG